MSIFKIIIIIVLVWFILKVKRFISEIQIESDKSVAHPNKKNRKISMDIQDADYEDLE